MVTNDPQTEADPKTNIALEEYKEVVSQFRKLTDIRFQLLAYLPLGTVFAAVFQATTKDPVRERAIAAFAFVVTICIATYDKRNDQHYDELVSRAAELERELGIEHGTFTHRLTPWLKFGFVPPDLPEWLKFRSVRVEHRWPIGLIYAAACCLWAYLFVNALSAPLWLQFTAPAAVILAWVRLRGIEKEREDEQRQAVKSLMWQLIGARHGPLLPEQAELVDKIAQQGILGISQDTAERRVAYHSDGDEQKTDARARAASALLAAIIDLPARWIEDVWSGRR